MAEELWTLPGANEVRQVYSLQFQRLTAEATREQLAIARQQLATTTQLTTELRQVLLQLTGVIEKNLLMPPAEPLLLQTPLPYHNLPQPTFFRLVGREQELAWLRERLLPSDRAWQIAIMGIGGVGKTALALALPASMSRNTRNCLGAALRRHHLGLGQGRSADCARTCTGQSARANPPYPRGHLSHFAQVLEREDITLATPEEQDYVVQKALRRQRTLLIIDNLESVKDERVKTFLYNLPEPSKAIITTRDRIETPAMWKLPDSHGKIPAD